VRRAGLPRQRRNRHARPALGTQFLLKLGYAGNGQHLVYRDDTRRTTEYRLRLDRQTWQQNRDSRPCVITGLAPCLVMFGLGNASTTTDTEIPAAFNRVRRAPEI
jgi:hypothetical protein